MKPVFIGSGVALITPFDKDGKIDFKRFEKLIEFHINNKSDAIIVCGTTGESAALTLEEKIGIYKFTVEKVKGKIPIICGTGSNSTSFALTLSKEAEKAGADGLLIVTPYYNKTSQKGLISHYFTIADNVKIPVIVYNVPSRTGMNIFPETYVKLSDHPNIMGVKEADTSITKLIKSINLTEGRLDFYIGNDDMISSAMAAGCKGVISVLANVLPRFTHKLTMEAYNGNIKSAGVMQKNASDLIEALFCDVNPIPVKAILKQLHFDSGVLRLPLVELSEEKKDYIRNIIIKYKDLIRHESFELYM